MIFLLYYIWPNCTRHLIFLKRKNKAARRHLPPHVLNTPLQTNIRTRFELHAGDKASRCRRLTPFNPDRHPTVSESPRPRRHPAEHHNRRWCVPSPSASFTGSTGFIRLDSDEAASRSLFQFPHRLNLFTPLAAKATHQTDCCDSVCQLEIIFPRKKKKKRQLGWSADKLTLSLYL